MSSSGKTRTVTRKWTWFTDYVFAYATFTINVPVGRVVEVGTGISFRGKPRGARRKVEGYKKITTVGAGAIHIRVVDGRGPCSVRVDQGDVGLIPVIDTPF